MKIVKKIIIVFLVLFFVVSIISGIIKSKSKLSDKEPTKVRVEQPTRGELIEFISATGEITPKRKVDISAKISARIIEIPDEEGLRVTKGDPLADPPIPPTVLVRLDDKDLTAALSSTRARRSAQAAQLKVSQSEIEVRKANIAECQAQLNLAQQQLSRQQSLWASKDISQSDLDDAQSRVTELTARLAGLENSVTSAQLGLDVLRFNLEAADAEIAQAEEALSYTTITAPIDGVITQINAEQGELVMTGTMNNRGTVIMTVANLSQMVFEAEVDEANVGKVKVGQTAKVRLQSWPDAIFTGTISQIALTYSTSRSGSKYYKTEIMMEQDDRLKFSGMTGDADIEIRNHQDILKAPSQAIVSRKADELPTDIRDLIPEQDRKKTFATIIYRYNDGKALAVPVTIGPSDATDTVILSGLSEQDRVITGPYKVLEKIKHDQNVIDEKEDKENNDKDNTKEKSESNTTKEENKPDPDNS